MFIAAIFTKGKTWKQTSCTLTNEQIKKMWHIYVYNVTLLSHKKNEILPFAATWMNLEIIILSKERKRKTNTI